MLNGFNWSRTDYGGFTSRKANGFLRTPLATCKQLVNTLSTVSRLTRVGVGRP
jgi:hypothetical protein